MLWSFEIGASVFFGFQLTLLLSGGHIPITASLSIGLLVGQYIFSWIVFLLSGFSDFSKWQGTFASSFLFVIGLILYKFFNSKVSYRHTFLFIPTFSLCLGIAFFAYTMYSSMMLEDMFTCGAGYGDMPFHLNIISSFVHGCNTRRKSLFDIMTLFYSGERLAYPLMSDFYSAALMLTGDATQRIALLAPSCLVAFSFVHSLYCLVYNFSKSHYAAALSLLIFINIGGMGFTYWPFGSGISIDFVHIWGQNHYGFWLHPIFHVLVPQRASLFSMPLCYWTLYLLCRGIQKKHTNLMALAGILTALTPLFQVHSYLSIAEWAILFCIATFPFKDLKLWPTYIKLWCYFGLIAVPFGLPQLYPFFNRVTGKEHHFVTFHLIYKLFTKDASIKSFFIMWWEALGLYGIIALVFGLVNLNKKQMKIYGISYIIWGITNVILYQPWEIDNLKIIYNVWVPFATAVVSIYYITLLKHKKTIPLAVIMIIITIMAALEFNIRTLKRKARLFTEGDLELGLWVAENTNTDSIFVVPRWHANTIETIAGRQVYFGFGGWVFSHGLEYRERKAENKIMLQNPNAKTNFIKNNITYVMARTSTDRDYFNNQEHLGWVKVFESRNSSLYRYIGNYSI